MKPRIMIPLLLVVGGVAALYWEQSRVPPPVVSGFIEADEIRVGSRVGGRVREVLVKEGQTVHEGDVLLRLEPYNLLELLAQARGELAAASAHQQKLTAGYRAEEIARARARRDQAQAALEQAKAGPRKQEIDEAADSLKLAEANLELAEATYQRIEKLFGSKSASREELDRGTSERKIARANFEVQRSRLEMLREGTRPEEIRQAEARLMAADAELAMLQNGYRGEEIAEAAARVDAARALVESVEKQIEELDVKSPSTATVEAVELRPGDLIAANAPVISLMDTRGLWVRAYVPENRLGTIRPDQTLRVRVDGFPDRTFPGRVSFVSRQAEFTPSNVQTPEERSKQVFRVKVDITEGTHLLRPGMAADLTLGEGHDP